MTKVIITTDHTKITEYCTRQHGTPVMVAGTHMLRIKFSKKFNEQLIACTWPVFFQIFEKQKLALLYNPSTRFNKFIKRKE